MGQGRARGHDRSAQEAIAAQHTGAGERPATALTVPGSRSRLASMDPPTDARSASDREAFVAEARERIARRRSRRPEGASAGPGTEATFENRYTHLLKEIEDLLEELPEIEREPLGPAGLRIRFGPTDREVRITPLEDQSLVHFVFGHATLGTLHRAEHHASRPFGDGPPDPERLLRQILGFLIEGVEPRWLNRRPPAGSSSVREPTPESAVLELPLD